MSETVFARPNVWMPRVIREGGVLRLELAAGADANHDPRTFTVAIDERHLAVIRDDLARHLLLYSALTSLWYAAGTRGPLDEVAAAALLDPILLAEPIEIDALFRRIRWDRARLIAQGADLELLEAGQIWSAMDSATETSNWSRVQEYEASRQRAESGVVLAPLDTAILRFTGHYLYGGASIPKRLVDAVDPDLLPDVVRVVATAEQACAGMRIGRVSRAPSAPRARR